MKRRARSNGPKLDGDKLAERLANSAKREAERAARRKFDATDQLEAKAKSILHRGEK